MKYIYKNKEIQDLMDQIHFWTGSIIHCIQKLEYKLALLVSVNKISYWYKKNKNYIEHKQLIIKTEQKAEKELSKLNHESFGRLVNQANQIKILNHNETKELMYVVEFRNKLVHQYFKKLIFSMEDKNIKNILQSDLITFKNIFDISRQWYLNLKQKWIFYAMQYEENIKNN